MTKYISIISVLLAFAIKPVTAAELDGTTTQWTPYLEWSFSNPTHSGNVFDLIATTTFTHSSSGETPNYGNVLRRQ